MKKELDRAGYDPENTDHFFISCGDAFDRGLESNKVLEYFSSLPEDRSVFVEGNHETNLKNILLGRRHWQRSDVLNGTVDTLIQLSGVDSCYDVAEAIRVESRDGKLRGYLDRLVNYYETEHYVFVHGWIPRRYDEEGDYTRKDWRKATEDEWYDARWYCGFDEWADMERKEPDIEKKTIVCGHWHTSYAHARFHHEGVEFPDRRHRLSECHFEPFLDDRIVGLDACTVVSQRVNVFVFEEKEREMH